MAEKVANSERGVAQIAARQYGVITSQQLYEAGIGKDAVLHRVRTSRLHRIHRGVYAVGHPRLSFEGRCLAAVLACSGTARSTGVRTHRSEAEPAAGGRARPEY